ncbi:MAG TPA: rod shape-determining protein MreC [Solirubrobacteraceae bacterium]|nr:rod shape-determining protein MreC [Solirubrobacteraceae bacterium]
MSDKTIRRRRAVLALLVALSLILLTAYFGEGHGGRLHAVQRDFLTVVSPIQDGANKALKPVRDLFGWFSSTLHAKSQRDELLKQNNRLRRELLQHEGDERAYASLRRLYHLDDELGASAYHAVTATVTGESPELWNRTIDINAGSGSGVRENDPVIVGEGLVGVVSEAYPDGAQVSLITDSGVGVTAEINETGAVGLVEPKVGAPDELVLQYLPATANVSQGQYVVTAGTVSSKDPSLFPHGIPIGQVSSVKEEGSSKAVDVQPLADLHDLETVQVLTYSEDSAAARASSFAAQEPPGLNPGGSGAGASEGKLASVGGGG